jgi:hypothetical protein
MKTSNGLSTQPSHISTLPGLADVTPDQVKLVQEGMSFPIRNMGETEYNRQAGAAILICAQAFCGADATKQSAAVYGECVNVLRKYYAGLGIEEVKEAFRLAAAGKITNSDGERISLTAYAGRFSAAMFGEILSSYQNWRGKIHAAILRQREGEDDRKRDMDRQANFARSMENLEDRFRRLCRTGGDDETKRWEDVPGWWAKILLDKGLLLLLDETKKDLWKAAKLETVAEAKREHSTGLNTILPDAKILRRAVRACEENPEVFPAELSDRARVVYGKMLVWECIQRRQ